MSPLTRRLPALLLAAAAAAALPGTAQAGAPPEGQPQIAGGQPASRAYPFQALLEIQTASGQFRCGGALVAARFLVTAAHCLVDEGNPTRVDVTLGHSDVSTVEPNFIGLAWTVHPSYRRYDAATETGGPGDGFDVAVVQLDKAADLEQLRLLRPADGSRWAAGVIATIVGWGLTEDSAQGGTRSDRLLEAQVPIYSDAACAADFAAAGTESDFFKPQTMLCAGGKDGRDSCQGDSGGPLLVPDGNRFSLGGVVSFGAILTNGDSCASGLPGVYSRVGADPLNGWVRSVVPQVEIDASPAEPEPGARVGLTASGSTPTGPYERFDWDLDNDGAYDDGSGPAASVVTPRGITTVAVRATRGAGDLRDDEIRRIDLEARFRSPVAFTGTSLTVPEGRPLTVTLSKTGSGAGALTATAAPGTAALGGIDVAAAGAIPVGFAADQTTQTFTVATVDDREVEGPETFTIELGGHSGELVPGSPGRLAVTIADDDVKPRITGLTRSARRRRGKVTLKYRISTAATVTLGITDARGRTVLAAARRRHGKPGTYRTALKLKKPALRLLRRKRAVTGRAVYAIFDRDDLLDSRILKFKLKR